MLPTDKKISLSLKQIHAILYHGSKIRKDSLYDAIRKSKEYLEYAREKDSVEFSDDWDEMCKQIDEINAQMRDILDACA